MIERETKETRIRCSMSPGNGRSTVEFSGVAAGSEPGRAGDGVVLFAKHMFDTLAKWSEFDLDLSVIAKDGLAHHAIEDAAIGIGQALRSSLDTGAIERTAHCIMPMDDALVSVALDLVERPYYEGPLPDPLMDHVLRSIATEGKLTIHVMTLRGRDPHHIVEAAFKGLGLCLGRATRPRQTRLSTKGQVEYR
ncbi:MAG: imidazoleglycerol-phosphate dehydratase [Candidatus Thermoplasmatota archaeon]